MPKVLFVVHGMGDNLPGWSKELVDFLDLALAQYPGFDKPNDQRFRELVQIEEICYDPVFDKLIAEWGRSGALLKQWTSENNIPLSGTLNRLAAGQLPAETEGFIWQTLLDPVLYRGSTIVRDKVRETVIRQLLSAWDRHLTHSTGTGQVDVSILCHSQGTIVMCDVLAHIGEARLSEFTPFCAEKRSIESLTTLANVSRLGPPNLIDIDSRDTCVRPQTAPAWKNGKVNYLRRYINARNKFDPFCFLQRFEPNGSWFQRYSLIEVDHIHQANTHGYMHYLANPRVHIPFFRAVIGPTVIDAAAAQEALDVFPDTNPPICGDAIDQLKQSLSALRDNPFDNGNGLDEFITRGIGFLAAVKQAAKDCTALVEGLTDD